MSAPLSVSVFAPLSVRLVLFLSLSLDAPVGQDLKWVTGLCLMDPHTATVVKFLSPGPMMRG